MTSKMPLIVSQIVMDAFNDLKMAYPKISAKGRRELQSIRKNSCGWNDKVMHLLMSIGDDNVSAPFFPMAMLLGMVPWGAAFAQDIQASRSPGKSKFSPTRERTGGCSKPGCDHRRVLRLQLPYCKKMAPVLQALLAQDPKIASCTKSGRTRRRVRIRRVVALAAGWQGSTSWRTTR